MTSRGREKHELAVRVVDRLRQYRLQLPALILLEAGQPLTFVAGQLLWMTQPMLALVMPRQALSGVAEMLEDPDATALLIELLSQEQNDQATGTEWIS